MSTITTTGSGNWSSTTPDAPWPSGIKPTTGDVVEIAAGHTVTLDESTATLGAAGIKNVAGSNTSVLNINGTVTINGNVSCSGTAATGFITLGTGDALTILGQVTQSGSGYCIVSSGTGTLTVTNTGGTAVSSSAGRVIQWGSTGTLAVTGTTAISTTGGRGITVAAAAEMTITGNVTAQVTGTSLGYGFTTGTGCTVSVDGNMTTTGAGVAAWVSGGTLTWVGNRTLAEGEHCYILVTSGTLALAVASTSHLALVNSGNFAIHVQSTGAVTKSATDHVATITQQTHHATCAILGDGTVAETFVVGPTLPAAADVQADAADYGYAGSLLDPAYPTTAATQAADATTLTGTTLDADGTDTTVAFGASNGTAKTAAVWTAALAAQLATDVAALNTNKDEMIAANTDLQAAFGCDAGTAPLGGGPLVGPSALVSC